MNGYAVQDAWVKHQQQQKAAAAAKRVAEQRERERAHRELAETIRARMPDMVNERGEVCGFAVYAASRLRSEGRAVTPTAIRERRLAHRMWDGRRLSEWEHDPATEGISDECEGEAR